MNHTTKCPECGFIVVENAEFCSECGVELCLTRIEQKDWEDDYVGENEDEWDDEEDYNKDFLDEDW